MKGRVWCATVCFACCHALVQLKPARVQPGVAATMSKRFNYVFADISKGVPGEKRVVVVRETDGTCRSANYEERYRVERYVSPAKLPPT